MAFGTEDANSEGTQAANEGQDSSSETAFETADDDGLFATHDFGVEESEISLEPGAGSEHDQDGKSEGTSEGAEQDTLKDQNQEPFHEHPRFQELVQGQKETRTALEESNRTNAELTKANRELLEKLDAREQAKQQKPEPTDEELSDMMLNRPGEYHKYIKDQAVASLKAESEKEKTAAGLKSKEQSAANATRDRYETFFTGKEELVSPLLADGSMEKYLMENPGSDPIHAFNALTEQSRIDAAVEKALKEQEAKLKSKGRFSPAPSGGGGGRTPTKPTEVKQTNNTQATKTAMANML